MTGEDRADSHRWSRVRSLFEGALELPRRNRPAMAAEDRTVESEDAELGDFLDPDYWIDGIHSLIDARFPNIVGSGLKAFEVTPAYFFPEVTVEWGLLSQYKTWGNRWVTLATDTVEEVAAMHARRR